MATPIVFTAALICLLLTACSSATTTSPTTGPPTTQTGTSLTVVTTSPPAVSSTVSTTPTTATTPWVPSSGGDGVLVYLTQGETLMATWRPTGPEPAVAVMQGLLGGPTTLEKEIGFGTTVPAGTTLRSVAVSGQTAVVDLSAAFGSGGGSLSMFLRVAQVVYSLTELPGVKRVEFMLDGLAVQALGGEGILVEGGVTRADFADLLPPVLLISPAPFETIRDTVMVRGNAAESIAALEILVTGRDGLILSQAAPQLQAPVDGRRAFEAVIALSGQAARGAVILAWTNADGARQTLEMPVEIAE